jgi:hypothetical protein
MLGKSLSLLCRSIARNFPPQFAILHLRELPVYHEVPLLRLKMMSELMTAVCVIRFLITFASFLPITRSRRAGLRFIC